MENEGEIRSLQGGEKSKMLGGKKTIAKKEKMACAGEERMKGMYEKKKANAGKYIGRGGTNYAHRTQMSRNIGGKEESTKAKMEIR